MNEISGFIDNDLQAESTVFLVTSILADISIGGELVLQHPMSHHVKGI